MLRAHRLEREREREPTRDTTLTRATRTQSLLKLEYLRSRFPRESPIWQTIDRVSGKPRDTRRARWRSRYRPKSRHSSTTHSAPNKNETPSKFDSFRLRPREPCQLQLSHRLHAGEQRVMMLRGERRKPRPNGSKLPEKHAWLPPGCHTSSQPPVVPLHRPSAGAYNDR